ncbi:hypothetical protein BGZ99_007619 [Dissophora globulifera]|uniref:F-box domain-containing protein n=1 Tax=Dissophora globulifera TaxID=979702 RepID=A0A9P6UQI2_9FUNG|nr:hypothetical protein BGZ99_007619 [Dissophora globulifera]
MAALETIPNSPSKRLSRPTALKRAHDATVATRSFILAHTTMPDDVNNHDSTPVRIPRPHLPWTDKALGIPEIVHLIQSRLDRSTLRTSLCVSRLWYHTAQPLVWRTVDWDNTLESTPREAMMQSRSHHIRTLRCLFHSQAGTSSVESSSLLQSFVTGQCERDEQAIQQGGPASALSVVGDATTAIPATQGLELAAHPADALHDASVRNSRSSEPRKRLQHLFLKGHFDLQSTATGLGPSPAYFSFRISTLSHLDIRPSVNSAVDIHLILDSATRLERLVIHSHGSFIDRRQTGSTAGLTVASNNGAIHHSLTSLTIHHLKVSRQELEGVAARCPNLTEFQSVGSPGALWTSSPLTLTHQPSGSPTEVDSLTQPKSLIYAFSKSCPGLQRLHVGLQQGGFHSDSVRETLTTLPQLRALGLPAWDCTKVMMDTLKSIQIESARTGTFLTSLCIMNVSSSEKVSQAIHDYLCWTPYLQEFYACNTTLYVEQMQQQGSIETTLDNQGRSPDGSVEMTSDERLRASDTRTIQATGSGMGHLRQQSVPESESSSGSHALSTDGIDISVSAEDTASSRQWACTRLERLVVRFAHLPWRSLAEPPKRSNKTFAFLNRLQKLKHLYIKEGLVLSAGREYDALAELASLEELVFTTCYPIPLKPSDMAWMEHTDGTLVAQDRLKRVVVRRQKANVTADKDIRGWFQEHRPDITFSLELADCCEDEYNF